MFLCYLETRLKANRKQETKTRFPSIFLNVWIFGVAFARKFIWVNYARLSTIDTPYFGKVYCLCVNLPNLPTDKHL